MTDVRVFYYCSVYINFIKRISSTVISNYIYFGNTSNKASISNSATNHVCLKRSWGSRIRILRLKINKSITKSWLHSCGASAYYLTRRWSGKFKVNITIKIPIINLIPIIICKKPCRLIHSS